MVKKKLIPIVVAVALLTGVSLATGRTTATTADSNQPSAVSTITTANETLPVKPQLGLFSHLVTLESNPPLQVTTTSDSGTGSLRQALLDANSTSGADSIQFAIPSSGVHIIQLSSALPTITDTVTIDGYSQTGAEPNTAVAPQALNGTLAVEVRGTGAINRGLVVEAPNTVVRGLSLNSFAQEAIYVTADNVQIVGNYIGTDAGGVTSRFNLTGVHLKEVEGAVVGGTDPADRNVVSGNQDFEINIDRSNNSIVQGNYFGPAADGSIPAVHATFGVSVLSSSHNQIGGTVSGATNVISGHPAVGAFVSSTDAMGSNHNTVQGNLIGTNISGQPQEGFNNHYAGLGFGGNVQNNLFGGDQAGAGNTIVGTEMVATGAMSMPNEGYVSAKNSMLGNKIFANTGMGIELMEGTPSGTPLSQQGRTLNDVSDSDDGPNNYLNYPVVGEATVHNNNLDVIFDLDIDDTAAATGYRVEFFASDGLSSNGDAQAESYVGSTIVAGDVSQHTASLAIPNGLVVNGKYITATTTEMDTSDNSFGSTSEYSVPVVARHYITITNTDDDGQGSLRQAIEDSNENPGEDVLDFNIPGTGVQTIQPETALPWIEDTVIIDGYSQNGASENTAPSPQPLNTVLKVELDGSNLPLADRYEGSLLKLRDSHNSTIKGLVINRAGANGIFAERANHLSIFGNFVGTNADGYNDLGNGRDPAYTDHWTGNGININASNHLQVGGLQPQERNLVAGSEGGDVYFGNEEGDPNPSEHNKVQGNYIGVARDGVTALPAGYQFGAGNGILSGNSQHDLIGGTQPGAMNVIASSYEFGVSFRNNDHHSRVEGNLIGTDYTGTQAMPHALGAGHAAGGVHIGAITEGSESHNITVGGSEPAMRNVISGNAHNGNPGAGGFGAHQGAYNIHVEGNYIGVDITGNVALANDSNGLGFTTDSAEPTVNNTAINNVISGNGDFGVAIFGATNSHLYGNTIGLGADGVTELSNTNEAVHIDNANGTVFGDQARPNKIFAGDDYDAMRFQFSDNVSLGYNVITRAKNGISLSGDDAVITGNTINASQDAIVVNGSSNELRDNVVQATQTGLTVNGDHAVIDNNTVSTALGSIYLSGNNAAIGNNNLADAQTSLNVHGNNTTIDTNNVAATQICMSYAGNEATVQNNTISGCQTGLSLNGNDAVVNANNVDDTSDGLNITGDSAILTSNTVANAQICIRHTGNGASIQNNMLSNCQTGLEHNGNSSTLQGNTIASDQTALSVRGNSNTLTGNVTTGGSMGIGITGQHNTIGSANNGNSISGYSSVGIILMADGAQETSFNTIRGNTIQGTSQASAGLVILGNVTDNVVGGVNGSDRNTISDVSTGIVIFELSSSPPPVRNSLLGNQITSVTNQAIDLVRDNDGDYQPDQYAGPNPNDANDEDTGPNDLLNTVVIGGANRQSASVDLSFSLDVNDGDLAPHGYRIEFYANGNAGAESDVFLGSTVVTGDVSNQTISLSGTLPAGNQWVTATVTEIDTSEDGFGSTSELSVPVQIVEEQLVLMHVSPLMTVAPVSPKRS